MGVSKTQVDRLGERLKGGRIEKADLQLLDEYRRSFSDAHDDVISVIRDRLDLLPTGRPAKSTPAIVDKLRRETIRLSQIQDIAGCRLVVSDLAEQSYIVTSLREAFGEVHVIDRRVIPSYGYRAVHVVVEALDRSVEVQVRTAWQHKWAEFSEKCADAFGTAVKYGGGHRELGELLSTMSGAVSSFEELELDLLVDRLSSSEDVDRDAARRFENTRNNLLSAFDEATAIALGALDLRAPK